MREARESPAERPRMEEEGDAGRIERNFVERPSESVELLANNLARPDGFAKSLILGKLLTSKELADRIAPEFVRSHRGYYMSFPRRPKEAAHVNQYLSFKVGKTQRLYAETFPSHGKESWRGGLGFCLPAQGLLPRDNVEVSWGLLHTYDALQKVKDTPLMEPQFEPLLGRSEDELEDDEAHPRKEDFLTRVHLSRKAGLLTEGDQAEINIKADAGRLPEIGLQQVIILAPEASREALSRLIRLKLREMKRWREKILKEYQLDVSELTPESVLAQYHSIYWYPQQNIELAVEYLSAHKEKIAELLKRGWLDKKMSRSA